MSKIRITRDEALSFLLTFLVIEKSQELKIDQLALFTLSNLAQQAADKINSEDALIPHEVIEAFAGKFLEDL